MFCQEGFKKNCQDVSEVYYNKLYINFVKLNILCKFNLSFSCISVVANDILIPLKHKPPAQNDIRKIQIL